MSKYRLLFVIIALFASGCSGLGPPGSQKRVTQTANILVFSDDNGNGKQDSGEAPLPDVLVMSESNIHGTFTRSGVLTDTDGKVTVKAEYTHFFNIQAIPPCGYQATTPISVEAKRNLSFGFQSQSLQSGSAELHFRLWGDINQDGIRQPDESPVAGVNLYVIPELDGAYAGDIVTGVLAIQTDANGEVMANLGNSCGEVTVLLQPDRSLGFALPDASEGKLIFTYQLGSKDIELGLELIEVSP